MKYIVTVLLLFVTSIYGLFLANNFLFPKVERLYQKESIPFFDGIKSCMTKNEIIVLAKREGYIYSEQEFVSEEKWLPSISVLEALLTNYKYLECNGQVNLKFINGHLSSALLISNTPECNISLVDDIHLKTEHGYNYEGLRYYFWSDIRIEKFYNSWISIFA